MKYLIRIEIETDDPTGQVAEELEKLFREVAEDEYDVKILVTDSQEIESP